MGDSVFSLKEQVFNNLLCDLSSVFQQSQGYSATSFHYGKIQRGSVCNAPFSISPEIQQNSDCFGSSLNRRQEQGSCVSVVFVSSVDVRAALQQNSDCFGLSLTRRQVQGSYASVVFAFSVNVRAATQQQLDDFVLSVRSCVMQGSFVILVESVNVRAAIQQVEDGFDVAFGYGGAQGGGGVFVIRLRRHGVLSSRFRALA